MIVFSKAIETAIRQRAKREGLKLHVVSYGGSGTSYTVTFLNHQLRTMSLLWHELINHYAVPLELGLPRLCLMADPPTAYASCIRRDNWRGVTRNLHGGQYGRDTIDGMIEFFDRWTVASPLVFCKYEALYEHLPHIEKELGVHFEHFPKKQPRKSVLPKEIDPRLLELRERFNALPDFFMNLPVQSCPPETQASSVP